jgi:hypothetical protein
MVQLRKLSAVVVLVGGLALAAMAGSYLSHPQIVQAACPVLPSGSGAAKLPDLAISSTGTYRIWSRLMAPDTTNNSYWLQIDDSCAINFGDTALTPNTWTWVDYHDGSVAEKIDVALKAGNHQLKLVGRETGVKVDRVLALSDLNCIPTGNGGNCSAASTTDYPPLVTSSEVSPSSILGLAVIMSLVVALVILLKAQRSQSRIGLYHFGHRRSNYQHHVATVAEESGQDEAGD